MLLAIDAGNTHVVFAVYHDAERLVQRIREESEAAMKVIACGGLVPLFAGGTKTAEHTDPCLRLSGMVEIWRPNPGVS